MDIVSRIVSATALFAVAVLAGGGQGAVLCLGADGHMAVEPGPCGEESEWPGDSRVDDGACRAPDCGPCIDLPLISTTTAAGRLETPPAPALLPGLLPAGAAERPLPCVARHVYESPPYPDPVLLSISTLVLLI